MKNYRMQSGNGSLHSLIRLIAASGFLPGLLFPVHANSTTQQKPVAVASSQSVNKKPSTLFQYSTLPALSLGVYDGDLTFQQLLQHGDFGLGTLNALDGEVIILNGRAWQVRSDGRVFPVVLQSKTPFAAVTFFAPHRQWQLAQPYEYSKLKARLTQLLPNANTPYAIRIRATLTKIKVRSVPRQQKPYLPLSQVVKTQSEWTWQNVRGTLVGFWFPTYMSNLNLADFHFHFLSDDRKRGGHVLDGQTRDAVIELQALNGFQMQLPQTHDFETADLSSDQKADLHKAENGSSK